MNYFTKDKPYNTLDQYYKATYNNKVAKIALNGPFTCPNKDGRKGFGGCTYCSKAGSGDLAGNKELSLKEQFNEIKEIMEAKWPNILYMPYLQSNSNTYAPIFFLKKIYEEVLEIEPSKTIGIAIATRPDCINDEIANYLGELNKKTHVQIELGLQTSNIDTAKKINRCSTNLEFSVAVRLLRKYNIEVVIHIINGLPGESKEDMLNTIKFLNKHDIQGIKIHSLLILKNTMLEKEYIENPFKILSLEEYVDITVEQIRLLNPNVIIHRLAADGIKDDLIAPKWTIKKLVVMNEIDKKLRENSFYQGEKYKAED